MFQDIAHMFQNIEHMFLDRKFDLRCII